jgi:glyoxylase-like metal-dependent hydrolase (beta-lactamase superfamily II)
MHTTDLGHGIHAVDTGFIRAHFDAAYLMVHGGRAAFIDTGHNAAVPRLLDALRDAGLSPQDVDWVIPTHVHLDHAGGVGSLLTHLPAARVLAHPRALPHFVDPGAIVAGAEEVYGKAHVAEVYGTIVAVPEDRIEASTDCMTIDLAGRPLLLLDTPGHARHHHCVWDAHSKGWFTGDTFGISYREFDGADGAFVFPSSTPVQFDPQQLRESVRRLLSFDPQVMYLTHYGPVRGVPRLGTMLIDCIDEMEAQALQADSADDRMAALRNAFANSLVRRARANCPAMAEATARELLAVDVELNAQGVAVWLDRRRKAAAR